jgi:hypothetical protein
MHDDNNDKDFVMICEKDINFNDNSDNSDEEFLLLDILLHHSNSYISPYFNDPKICFYYNNIDILANKKERSHIIVNDCVLMYNIYENKWYMNKRLPFSLNELQAMRNKILKLYPVLG